ncbi:hypothetical protein SAMN06264364_14910 [Quadrisphaera granulorum]|uniref:Uncharacterized protein n=1 Tax=Quadrisphaera granulorum TaxID=317664 RepID=A0A315ZNQ6_9ACTN|nr:hypothetical protein [Quadrisphaera granulorum]PWJ46274.1 hypothetical protein BXY45_14910 [Quadrisphaera granulorum]SZE99089.1 hypothetical protein SAMN06264364_14910 [Quadrisphaera granulorum]
MSAPEIEQMTDEEARAALATLTEAVWGLVGTLHGAFGDEVPDSVLEAIGPLRAALEAIPTLHCGDTEDPHGPHYWVQADTWPEIEGANCPGQPEPDPTPPDPVFAPQAWWARRHA